MQKTLHGGAIRILENLGIVDTISFGTETEDFAALNNIANIITDEPKEFSNLLRDELKQGVSFPKAREKALIKFLNDDVRYKDILNNSNNILGVEYLKALKKLKSNITPVAIKREKVYYNDNFIVDDFASATAIRRMLVNKDFGGVIKVVPRVCYETLSKEFEVGNIVLDLQRFEKEIFYTLRKMTIAEISNLPDVTEGLENTIKNAANFCNNIKDFINIVKTKRYTQTRIQRILVFALLGITKKDVMSAKKIVPYARVLGFNEKGKLLLSGIAQNNSKMEVVTSVKRFMDNNTNKIYKRMMEIDIFATDVYTLGYRNDSMANLDYTKNMIMV